MQRRTKRLSPPAGKYSLNRRNEFRGIVLRRGENQGARVSRQIDVVLPHAFGRKHDRNLSRPRFTSDLATQLQMIVTRFTRVQACNEDPGHQLCQSQPQRFGGYAPGSEPYEPQHFIGHPRIRRWMLAAALYEHQRQQWQNFD